jgi:hypothetical protein
VCIVQRYTIITLSDRWQHGAVRWRALGRIRARSVGSHLYGPAGATMFMHVRSVSWHPCLTRAGAMEALAGNGAGGCPSARDLANSETHGWSQTSQSYFTGHQVCASSAIGFEAYLARNWGPVDIPACSLLADQAAALRTLCTLGVRLRALCVMWDLGMKRVITVCSACHLPNLHADGCSKQWGNTILLFNNCLLLMFSTCQLAALQQSLEAQQPKNSGRCSSASQQDPRQSGMCTN